MQLYADMIKLEEIKAKNERAKEIIIAGSKKIEVIEDSQRFIMDMLDGMEKEMGSYLEMANNMRPRTTTLMEDNQDQPLHLQSDNQRLFYRLNTLCKDLHANDALIGEAVSKLQQMELIEGE